MTGMTGCLSYRNRRLYDRPAHGFNSRILNQCRFLALAPLTNAIEVDSDTGTCHSSQCRH